MCASSCVKALTLSNPCSAPDGSYLLFQIQITSKVDLYKLFKPWLNTCTHPGQFIGLTANVFSSGVSDVNICSPNFSQ